MNPSRRSFLAGTAALGSATALGSRPQEPAERAATPPVLSLRSAPARVFKSADPGKEDTESWCTHLALQAPDPGPWTAEELEVAFESAGTAVSRSTSSGSVLAALRTDLLLQGTPSSRRSGTSRPDVARCSP